jgi:hypothetical protein
MSCLRANLREPCAGLAPPSLGCSQGFGNGPPEFRKGMRKSRRGGLRMPPCGRIQKPLACRWEIDRGSVFASCLGPRGLFFEGFQGRIAPRCGEDRPTVHFPSTPCFVSRGFCARPCVLLREQPGKLFPSVAFGSVDRSKAQACTALPHSGYSEHTRG